MCGNFDSESRDHEVSGAVLELIWNIDSKLFFVIHHWNQFRPYKELRFLDHALF